MQLNHTIPLRQEKNYTTWIGFFVVVLVALFTGYITNFNLLDAIVVIPGVFHFIFTDFLPPAVISIPEIIGPLLDTIYMAIISTLLGSVISILLALLCANVTTPHPLIKVSVRAVASLLRNIPALAWTIILVPAFGIGKTVGLIALMINAVGHLTRSFAETIEEIDRGGIEAIHATGGSYWQVLKNGVLPQCTPGLISWTLYNLEIDIRSSTIIGMVGGGGIGFFIQYNIKLFRYNYATMAIIAVAVAVLLIDYLSKKIREKIM